VYPGARARDGRVGGFRRDRLPRARGDVPRGSETMVTCRVPASRPDRGRAPGRAVWAPGRRGSRARDPASDAARPRRDQHLRSITPASPLPPTRAGIRAERSALFSERCCSPRRDGTSEKVLQFGTREKANPRGQSSASKRRGRFEIPSYVHLVSPHFRRSNMRCLPVPRKAARTNNAETNILDPATTTATSSRVRGTRVGSETG